MHRAHRPTHARRAARLGGAASARLRAGTSPSDNVANQLNQQELQRVEGGSAPAAMPTPPGPFAGQTRKEYEQRHLYPAQVRLGRYGNASSAGGGPEDKRRWKHSGPDRADADAAPATDIVTGPLRNRREHYRFKLNRHSRVIPGSSPGSNPGLPIRNLPGPPAYAPRLSGSANPVVCRHLVSSEVPLYPVAGLDPGNPRLFSQPDFRCWRDVDAPGSSPWAEGPRVEPAEGLFLGRFSDGDRQADRLPLSRTGVLTRG